MADPESIHNNEKKCEENMQGLPEFFQKEFPNLSRFLCEDLLKDLKTKNINKADIYKC